MEQLKIEPVKRYSLDNETLLSRCSKQTLKLALTCVKSFKNNMENISRITDCIKDSEASQVSSDGEITEHCRGNYSNELQACEEGDQQQVLWLESTDRRIENVTNPSKKLFRSSKSKRERCHICQKEMLLQNLKDHMKNAHNSTEVRVLGQKSLIELFGNKVKDNNVKRKRGHSDVDEEPLLKTAKTDDLYICIYLHTAGLQEIYNLLTVLAGRKLFFPPLPTKTVSGIDNVEGISKSVSQCEDVRTEELPEMCEPTQCRNLFVTQATCTKNCFKYTGITSPKLD